MPNSAYVECQTCQTAWLDLSAHPICTKCGTTANVARKEMLHPETEFLDCAPCNMIWREPKTLSACPKCQSLAHVRRLRAPLTAKRPQATNVSSWNPRLAAGDCIICASCYHSHRISLGWLQAANRKMRQAVFRPPYLCVSDQQKFRCSHCGEFAARIFDGARARRHAPSSLVQMLKDEQEYYVNLEASYTQQEAESLEDHERAERYWRSVGAYAEFDAKRSENAKYQALVNEA